MERRLAALIAWSWLFAGPAWAHGPSEASADASALSIATVMSGVAGSAAMAVAMPVALSATGGVLVVRSVEVSARGTVCVLERLSDGARATVNFGARGVRAASIAVGTTLTTTVTASGVVLSIAGEAIAFIPNQVGLALLHDERLTR
jgi:hypothetical protein